MPKINNPATIATQFGIDAKTLVDLGVVNVLLNTDTPLFIDPLLLSHSEHEEIRVGAHQRYTNRFQTIIKLLAASKEKDDLPWRSAQRLFRFSEISWTCLGYGSSVNGSGFGKDLVSATLETAAQIVALGVTDVDLFMALALFEEGIGPDRISDMTTNIVLPDLVEFSRRINETLMLPTRSFKLSGVDTELIVNPFSEKPLLLVPADIVRDLPIATDWSDISHVVRENEELRDKVNGQIGEIWATMSKEDKARLKRSALSSKAAFDQVMTLVREVAPSSYDLRSDPNGELFWTELLTSIAREYPVNLTEFKKENLSLAEAKEVVNAILRQFKDLVENKGLWKELWDDTGKPRREKAAQRLLFAVAYSYCKANNLDLTPEADSGNGPVDFKVSRGFDTKIVVEIKLSTNGKTVHGYEKQLEIYKKADDTDVGIFVLIDVGLLGQKYATIQRVRNEFLANNGVASDIWYVNGLQKDSASKRD
ncbi:MAG: hypothetical protein A3F76_12925 [Burkholderiales bacterium RIFCSPLOWO2_12_FULL_65_40]|nr:MAG: hypothetical protein A2Z55_04520 [Burkholderiales bacterium RIFCSPHIGHO2_12_63_9]OGB48393.1 MAG: hypothetical protein A3F76_12925 [Burkholderiales bacterium RIFCSPLOWO2_12_FULL_65_40]